MSNLFHGAMHRRRPGDIIEAGHYGRMVSTPAHYHHIRERQLEAARLLFAPHMPSRLDAVFCCPSETGLRRYIDEMCFTHPGRRPKIMYEVEMVEPASTMHHGDWRLPQPGFYRYQSTSDLMAYWIGVDCPNERGPDYAYDEVVTVSALRVLREFD